MAEDRPALNRLDVLHALRISNWEAVFSTVHATLTGGAFQTGYALWLGASNFWMGVLSSIPTFAGLVQIFSSYFVERRGERKRFTAWFSGLSRLLWLPILLVPFLLPREAWFSVFVGLFLVSSVFLSVPVPAFTSWMSDLVPPDNRGRYFGRRNMLAGITVMVVALPAGWFLDLAVKYHRFSEAVGFAVLFLVAVLFGVAGTLALLRQPEPPMRRMEVEEAQGLRGLLVFYRAPFGDRGFRKLLTFNTHFAMAQFLAAPFYTVYALEVLKLNYMWLQILGAVASLTGLLSMPLWGYLGDKFGNKPLIAIAVCGTGLLPLAWIFTSPAHPVATLVIIFLNNLAGGLFWSGVGLAGFNLLIETTPTERKSVYIGAMSAVTGVAGGLAPILGGAIMTALPERTILGAGLAMSNFHILFACNSVLRYLSLFSLRGVMDTSAASARAVLTQLGSTRMGTIRHIRRLQGAYSETERREAAQALRSARTALAVEELMTALDDPSLHVREEAAEALGEIGDPRAVEALVARLDDPASGIVDEAAEALGRIGDERAVAPLARLLAVGANPDRVIAARALGRIAGPEARDSLLSTLEQERDSDSGEVMEACVAALGRIGDPAAAPALSALLPTASRNLRLALVRSLGDIADPSAAEPLLRLLREEQDPAVIAHMAVSLAMMERTDAVRPLLDSMERVVSPIARKQIVNSVGALIGEGEGLYPLLAQESYARDEAVSRMLRDLARPGRAEDRADFRTLRRSRRWNRILDDYMAGQFSRAVSTLAQQAGTGEHASDHPAAIVLAWIGEASERRPLAPEEFLLALFAARQSLESRSGP